MARYAFTKLDFSLSRGVLRAAIAVTLVVMALRLRTWWAGDPLTWTVDVDRGQAVSTTSALRPGASAHFTGATDVFVEHASGGLWLVSLAPLAILAMTVISVCLALLRLLRVVRQGEAFVPATATTLRLTGLLVVVGTVSTSLAFDLADDVLASAVFRHPDSMGVNVLTGPITVALVAGLVLELFAEVVSRGSRMAEDLEGVI